MQAKRGCAHTHTYVVVAAYAGCAMHACIAPDNALLALALASAHNTVAGKKIDGRERLWMHIRSCLEGKRRKGGNEKGP